MEGSKSRCPWVVYKVHYIRTVKFLHLKQWSLETTFRRGASCHLVFTVVALNVISCQATGLTLSMTIPFCTSKILKFENCPWKMCQLTFLGRTGWKGESTLSTLNTEVVPLLLVFLHPNDVARVGWEPGATNDSLVVL
jgi:hypothetical protein